MRPKWISVLRRWIRQLFRGEHKRHSAPKVLKSWYGTDSAVLRIERNTPGGIATYRISSIHGQCDYLITLDYLPDLQAELVGEFNGTPFRLRHHSYLVNTALTHRFAVWRIWRNGNSNPVGIWDCDLQGFTTSVGLQKLAPIRAVEGVVRQSLYIVHFPRLPLLDWQSQIERLDWLGLLEDKIRQELQNPNHNFKACVILQDSPNF